MFPCVICADKSDAYGTCPNGHVTCTRCLLRDTKARYDYDSTGNHFANGTVQRCGMCRSHIADESLPPSYFPALHAVVTHGLMESMSGNAGVHLSVEARNKMFRKFVSDEFQS